MAAETNVPPRRSIGQRHIARALWYTEVNQLELRTEQLSRNASTPILIRTHYSALSRGTERLIFQGAVPQSEWHRMRAPHQSGAFPFPVKYGYSAAGCVEQGPDELLGQNVFCLYPHQDLFLASPDWLVPIPESVPLKRATLAANMETALNAIWDSGATPADHICVIGAGVVGLLVGHLASCIPGTTVTIVDIAEHRSALATALGMKFTAPNAAPDNADIVFHTSATAQGLTTAINCAGFEAAIIEMSWYGDRLVEVPLGGAFHSKRLRLISSQVGHVSPSRRPRWPHKRRAIAAMALLNRPELDALVSTEISFSDAVEKLPHIFSQEWTDLPPLISYT